MWQSSRDSRRSSASRDCSSSSSRCLETSASDVLLDSEAFSKSESIIPRHRQSYLSVVIATPFYHIIFSLSDESGHFPLITETQAFLHPSETYRATCVTRLFKSFWSFGEQLLTDWRLTRIRFNGTFCANIPRPRPNAALRNGTFRIDRLFPPLFLSRYLLSHVDFHLTLGRRILLSLIDAARHSWSETLSSRNYFENTFTSISSRNRADNSSTSSLTKADSSEKLRILILYKRRHSTIFTRYVLHLCIFIEDLCHNSFAFVSGRSHTLVISISSWILQSFLPRYWLFWLCALGNLFPLLDCISSIEIPDPPIHFPASVDISTSSLNIVISTVTRRVRNTLVHMDGYEQEGKLDRSCRRMYDTRDAASMCVDKCSDVLKENSMKYGVAYPVFFCIQKMKSQMITSWRRFLCDSGSEEASSLWNHFGKLIWEERDRTQDSPVERSRLTRKRTKWHWELLRNWSMIFSRESNRLGQRAMKRHVSEEVSVDDDVRKLWKVDIDRSNLASRHDGKVDLGHVSQDSSYWSREVSYETRERVIQMTGNGI